ncbi:MAG: TonB-dependent receptor [Pseudomonadota bacterium]
MKRLLLCALLTVTVSATALPPAKAKIRKTPRAVTTQAVKPAATPPPASTATRISPITVTALRESEALADVPQPITVVTGAEVKRRNPQVMTEALKGEPGAYFQQTGPGQGIVIVRGLKGSEVLHLVDGVRLNNAFFRTAPSQYIALVDPQNIDRLELLRGPYAAVYGSDALGGVVQVLTPEYRFSGDALGYEGGVRLSYNSADIARIGRAYAATGNRDFSIAAGISYAAYGNRRLAQPGQSPDGAGGTSPALRVNGTSYFSRSYDFKTLWNVTSDDELMFSFQYLDVPKLPRYNEIVQGFGAAPAVAQSFYDNQREFYHLRYRRRAPLGFMDSLELHVSRQVVTDDRIDRTRVAPIRDIFEFNQSSLDGFTAQARTQLNAEHTLRYGLDLYTDEVDSRTIRETPPGSGVLTFNSTAGFQSRFPDGSTSDDYGFYAFDEWNLLPRLLLDLGLRVNHVVTELALSDRASAATVENTDLSGSVGARYALAPTLSWNSNFGRGFRAPNINDLAQFGARAGGRFVVPNTTLTPEGITSIDTGLKWNEGPWQVDATAFYSSYEDRITLVANVFAPGVGGCPATEVNPCQQNQNIAGAYYWGFESGVRYQLLTDLSLRGVLNFTQGTQEINGVKTPANRVPPFNGQVSAVYNLLPNLTFEPYVFFAESQHRLDPTDLADNRINPNGTAGYVVANLRMAWEPIKDYRLQLDGTNLLNKAYREHGSGIDGRASSVGLTAEARFR